MYTDYTETNNEDYYDDGDKNNKFDKEKLKKIALIIGISAVLIVLIIIIARGCSKKDNDSDVVINEQTPTVVLSRNSLSLNVSETFALDVDVLLSSNDPVISWYSEDSSIASVDDYGLITAESEGETNIVAVYRENGKIYQDTCIVTVTSNVIKPEKISLGQESVSIKVGGSLLLQVTVEPSDASVDNFIFSSEDPSVASVNEKGYVQANSVGTTSINVTTSDESISSSIIINVTENITVINPTSLEIKGLANGISVGQSSEIIYNIGPSNTTNRSITWTSSDNSIAVVNDGVVTGVNPGTCTIVATTVNGISDSFDITVTSNIIAVTGIDINGETSISMNVGWTRQIKYTITPIDATNKKVKYTSSNPNVVFVESNGIIAAVSKGTALITVTTEDGNKTAIVNVTVN